MAHRFVDNKEIKVNRGRKRRRSYTYILYLKRPSIQDAYKVPQRLRVGRGTYAAINAGDEIAIEIGPGRLGFPWYKNVQKKSW